MTSEQSAKSERCRSYIGGKFSGALAYADDVILFSPTRDGLISLLNICSVYANQFDVLFNSSKSGLVIFGPKYARNTQSIPFMGGTINRVDCERHLDISFGHVTQGERVAFLYHEMTRKTSMVRSHFLCLPTDAHYFLFNSYCMPLYGCQLLDLSSSDIDQLLVSWRKVIRFLLDLPRTTHCFLLHHICNDIPISHQLYARITKFFRALHTSLIDLYDFVPCSQLKKLVLPYLTVFLTLLTNSNSPKPTYFL